MAKKRGKSSTVRASAAEKRLTHRYANASCRFLGWAEHSISAKTIAMKIARTSATG
jgi:hypothetical protein